MKFRFEVEKPYKWVKEIEATTQEEAEEKLWNETFEDSEADRGYLEIMDVEEVGEGDTE